VGACLCAAEFVDCVALSGVVSSIEEEHELEFGSVWDLIALRILAV
jgi:hypothetical protein